MLAQGVANMNAHLAKFHARDGSLNHGPIEAGKTALDDVNDSINVSFNNLASHIGEVCAPIGTWLRSWGLLATTCLRFLYILVLLTQLLKRIHMQEARLSEHEIDQLVQRFIVSDEVSVDESGKGSKKPKGKKRA